MHIRCPHCHNPIEIAGDASLTEITCPSCHSSFSLVGENTVTVDQLPARMLGRFELLDLLGAGGFGSVWKGRDPELDRTVAVKVPRKEQLSANEVELFLREARAAAQLRHPNIVTVHEIGREGDTIYIVSDFIKGVSLSDWLTARRFSHREAAELVAKLAETVHHAHEAGVIHRDLKPANIIMGDDGAPHVMDFGLAKREAGEITMTVDGKILGTPAYMAPEQAAGKGHDADRRSDAYSLGVILFQLMTGELPFRGNQRMLLHQVINDEPPSPRKLDATVPKDLETICLKCLEKQPAKRYSTAGDLAQDLRRWLGHEPILARPISRIERGLRWCKRKPAVAALSGGIFLSLGLGMVVSLWFAAVASRRASDLQQSISRRIDAQVDALMRADTNQVPSLLESLGDDRAAIAARCRTRLADKHVTDKERTHLALALVNEDQSQVEFLKSRLVAASPGELLVIRAALESEAPNLSAELWARTLDSGASSQERLRLAAALARFDPDSSNWEKVAAPIVGYLVAENPLLLADWINLFRAVRAHLLGGLIAIHNNEAEAFDRRLVATTLLVEFVGDDPRSLVELILSANPQQFRAIYPKLESYWEPAVAAMTAELAKGFHSKIPAGASQVKGLLNQAAQLLFDPFSVPVPGVGVVDARRILDSNAVAAQSALAKRQANAAIALLRLGEAQKVWPLLKHSPDPEARSWIIHRVAPMGVDPAIVVRRIERESNVSVRRALILMTGEYDENAEAPETHGIDRAALTLKFLDLYQNDPDPGIHGASAWVLRRWGMAAELAKLDIELANLAAPFLGTTVRAQASNATSLKPDGDHASKGKIRLDPSSEKAANTRRWYITKTNEHTLTVIPGPVEFLMGSPPTEPGRAQKEQRLHRRRVGRSFAIATTEVTVRQFRAFQAAAPNTRRFDLSELAPADDCPHVYVDWYDAAKYCRWLSEQEGVAEDQMCYPPIPAIKEGMTLPKDYLARTGYRLPTEGEWEYACRSGAMTSRYFGQSLELLSMYAWHRGNSKERSHPVGVLKPNELGLFDVLGNAWEWTTNVVVHNPEVRITGAVDDLDRSTTVLNKDSRGLRGGAWDNLPNPLRAARQFGDTPDSRPYSSGFRVARTYP